ncbi:hypothetical protein T07_14179 [Trichinella nelsoni]|uniref:Uncharacterized protein n=1 Tax=Trichinella nelsoni TaxID=6336 RepID=A0A0V0S087_9BILA|nr:hypothetical protein T07_14179 [Trichinella nelsoni]
MFPSQILRWTLMGQPLDSKSIADATVKDPILAIMLRGMQHGYKAKE